VNAVLGDAVVADFDGTLARLVISWQTLRETLAVARIEDLWLDPDRRRWEPVTRAEVEAARTAAPVSRVIEALEPVPSLAVLTNNDETAVDAFLDRWPALHAKVRTIVGRKALNGPKTDFDVFATGYAACVNAIAVEGAAGTIAYIGDMRYELDYARRLGANTFDVKEFEETSQRRGRR
jgi:phosphoglycolate phosphatase-like HAD superfamily hydrolase